MRDSFQSVYVSVKAKLSTLKKKYIDGDKSAIEKIAQWEKDVEQYRLNEEFSQNPKVQELYRYYKAKAIAFSRVLSTKEDLTLEERREVFARRKEVYGFLRMLGVDALKDIEEIEKNVDFELEEDQ